ncbi:hypothetical protein NKF06_06420 [Haloferax sp. AB510]|uniref:hypothetical protein n=1 Tax=Haloferax sp. AB510 TaxID=2934172 RepID=UPI00209C3B1C|nr:hypothetical protein [Haloferax sp. AB510]MCO8266227.1 hypothetical protein [Haloferax sp. AB510]
MPSRRQFIAATVGTVPLAGCSLTPDESGNIQIGNLTEQKIWVEITIRRDGGVFSNPKQVYRNRSKKPPANGYRSTLTDVVRPGTYDVQVEAESIVDEKRAQRSTQWKVTGEKSQSLIIHVLKEFKIEFFKQ